MRLFPLTDHTGSAPTGSSAGLLYRFPKKGRQQSRFLRALATLLTGFRFNTPVTTVCYVEQRNPMGIPRPALYPQPRETSKLQPTPPVSDERRPDRVSLNERVGGRVPDQIFRYAMIGCGLSVTVSLGLIFYELVVNSNLSLHQFGWKFFTGQTWDPVNNVFGALPFIYGTIVSSIVALVLAVPLGLGVAVFITEMCPQRLRGVLSFSTELLAAIRSVIYGLWAIFALVPILRLYVEPPLMRYFGWTGLFEGPPYGIGMLAAGIVLAIMVIPIISSLTREVLSAVPRHQREAALALGATSWEMIRV